MVPTERPRCFESFARALLALSFLLHRHLLLFFRSLLSLLFAISLPFLLPFSPLSLSFPFWPFLCPPSTNALWQWPDCLLYQRPFSQRWEKISTIGIGLSAAGWNSIEISDIEASNRFLTISVLIVVARSRRQREFRWSAFWLRAEWENKRRGRGWMSNRIWNIYGWCPLVETEWSNRLAKSSLARF